MRKGVLFLLAALLAACRNSGPPYSPQEALKTFQIEPGYRIELFASEPEVDSPVSMDIDENGNIYVVEDRGYPINIEGKLGRVKLLRDTNGDGMPDRTTIFADHLVMPTGVMRWKKGILVTDTPDVWYLEDTNGDGVSDIKRRVLTGFPFTNPQHTVNGLIYGPDNWIYLAHEGPATAVIFQQEFGDRGSDIRYTDREDVPPVREHRNIRFRPDTNQLEALSSSSQFGHSFDDWGRHFTVSNSNHARMEAVAARYLNRNRDLPVGNAVEEISDHGAASKVFPITTHPRFELLTGVGEFSSACSITFFRGSTFVAEPAHGIVHRDVLSDSGALYVARRARPNIEFLASTDAWFRPVNFYPGPDGALYLLDYYRMIIEHPEWMSTKHHHSPDLFKGIDRGRIYRIAPEGVGGPVKSIRLGSASNQDLAKELVNPVAWWRRTAQRLLVDRKAVDVVPDLERLFEQTTLPQGRVQILWTLEGLGKLDAGLVRKALADSTPGVRENGIRLAELHLRQSPELERDLLALGADPDSRVRYQLLLTLGFFSSADTRALREKLLFDNLEDKWFQVAALSANSDDAPRLFAKATSEGSAKTDGRSMLIRYLASEIGVRQRPGEIEGLVRKVVSGPAGGSWWESASLAGLNTGMRGKTSKISNQTRGLLVTIFETASPEVRHAALRLLEMTRLPSGPDADKLLRRSTAIVRDPKADSDLRADSIGILALADPERNAPHFESLIEPHQPEAVQSAAVRAYGKVKGDAVGKLLLKDWRSMSPSVRADAADAMLLEPSRARMLVAALKSGDVQPWTLAFRHKRRLIMNTDAQLRETARPLLEQTPADREAVVKRYQAALDRAADAARGREVFRTVCAKCHRLEGHGAETGPDLLTVQHKPKQFLLNTILIPSESIAQGYESYVVETFSGGTLDGVLGPQSPATITLRHEDGKEDIVHRQDIKNMYVTNLSAMPADLEKQVDLQQMADLLEYLKTVH